MSNLWVLETKTGIFLRMACSYYQFVKSLSFLGQVTLERKEHIYGDRGAIVATYYHVRIYSNSEGLNRYGVIRKYDEAINTVVHIRRRYEYV